MKRIWIKKYLKKIINICVWIVIVITVSGGGSHAMELRYEEKDDLGRPKLEEHEMNSILEMLEIKEWNKPFYKWNKPLDELQIDEPLGRYTVERLGQCTGENIDIEVEIEYFLEISRRKNEKENSIQVIKIYENNMLTRLGYNMWDPQRNCITSPRYYELDNIKMEELNLEKGWEEIKYKPIKENTIFDPIRVMKSYYKSHYKSANELEMENFLEVVKNLMTIQNFSELPKLIELPLTQEFYYRCVENFPYFEKPDGSCRFYYDFYGMGAESKFICVCSLVPEDNEIYQYAYYVEIWLKDAQIDDMKIKLLSRNMPAG